MAIIEKWKASKDPQDVKDYDINWRLKRLLAGENLASSVWTIVEKPSNDDDNPLVIMPASTFTNDFAKVWLSGGVAGKYKLLNHVVTNSTPQREYDKTMILTVETL